MFRTSGPDVSDVELAVHVAHAAGGALGRPPLFSIPVRRQLYCPIECRHQYPSPASRTAKARLNPPISASVSPVSTSTSAPASAILATSAPPPDSKTGSDELTTRQTSSIKSHLSRLRLLLLLSRLPLLLRLRRSSLLRDLRRSLLRLLSRDRERFFSSRGLLLLIDEGEN